MESPQKKNPALEAEQTFESNLRVAIDAARRSRDGVQGRNFEYAQGQLKLARRFLKIASYHADLAELLRECEEQNHGMKREGE